MQNTVHCGFANYNCYSSSNHTVRTAVNHRPARMKVSLLKSSVDWDHTQ